MTPTEIIARINSDPKFAARYANLKTIPEIQAQAASDGISVSAEDIQTVIASRNATAGELSEDALAAVAGGGGEVEKVTITDARDANPKIFT